MSLYAFNLLVVGIQTIKDNWPIYRCQPLIMPFAGMFGHDPRQNFSYCIKTMQKNFMETLLKPLNFNIGLLGDITGGLTTGLDHNRSFMGTFRLSLNDAIMNIFSTIFNMTIEMQRLFINIKDMVGKIMGIMATNLYIISGSLMTMESAWSGPPGQLVKALCFHPDTQIEIQRVEIQRVEIQNEEQHYQTISMAMKDIPLNSILKNGARVCAVMQISNLDKNNAIVEKMYNVPRYNNNLNGNGNGNDTILVSGSHLIYNPSIKQFVHVKDLPEAECTEIDCPTLTCLITSDHTISIGDWIFHDWEDSNGSAPKNIGNN